MNEKAFRSNSVEVEFQDLAAQVPVANFLLDAGNRYDISLEVIQAGLQNSWEPMRYSLTVA
jgi:hypothetical protein